MSATVVFSMTCPECDEEVHDIEVLYTEVHGSEEFWDRPVTTDDSEAEVDNVPDCEKCGKQTITDDKALDHFWSQEVPDV